jgi:hypothetical protein
MRPRSIGRRLALMQRLLSLPGGHLLIRPLQQGAEARGRWALALGVGIAYDTGLSPVDVRSITLRNVRGAGKDRWIETSRKKTKRVQKHAVGGKVPERTGASDGARTRDLRRDRTENTEQNQGLFHQMEEFWRLYESMT